MTKKKHPADITQATYTPEYRAEAVKLALASVTVSEAARNLGISEKTLHRWVSAERKAGASGTTVDATKTANAEIARLKRELARAQQERDFSYGPFLSRGPKTVLAQCRDSACYRSCYASHRISNAMNGLSLDDGSSSYSRVG